MTLPVPSSPCQGQEGLRAGDSPLLTWGGRLNHPGKKWGSLSSSVSSTPLSWSPGSGGKASPLHTCLVNPPQVFGPTSNGFLPKPAGLPPALGPAACLALPSRTPLFFQPGPLLLSQSGGVREGLTCLCWVGLFTQKSIMSWTPVKTVMSAANGCVCVWGGVLPLRAGERSGEI